MNSLEKMLNRTNLAAQAAEMDKSIPVEVTRVITADPTEYGGARTVTEAVTRHGIGAKDRVAVRGEEAWHGLGEKVPEDLTPEEAVARFLPWQVVQMPVYTYTPDANGQPSENRIPLPLKANFREDTPLGIVSQDYIPIQNDTLGRFASSLIQTAIADKQAAVCMETCGSLLGGRKVFLSLRFDKDIRVGATGQDRTVPLLTLLNSHDGTTSFTALWTFFRVVCNNTFVSALGGFGQRGFRIRHMGRVEDYLQTAQACLGLAAKGIDGYQHAATQMFETKLSQDRLRAYFTEVYESIYGGVTPTMLAEAREIAKMRQEQMIDEWLKITKDDAQNVDGMEGTLWAAFNTVTQYQDHVRAARAKSISRQNHNKMFGDAAVAKDRAYRAAVALLS